MCCLDTPFAPRRKKPINCIETDSYVFFGPLSRLFPDKCPLLYKVTCSESESRKDYFGLKCILSYYVPVQTIVSPYDANCVTPLIYPTTNLDFLFGIIVSFDFSFYFYFFLKPEHNLFCKRHYPVIVITTTRNVLYTGKCTRLYILEIIKA